MLHEDALRLGVSVVSLDRPGVGGSSYHGRRTLESTTEDALALMQELGITKAAVIGCSGGAPYAAALTLRHPQQVGSLTVISGVGPTDWRHRSLLRAMSGMDRVQFGVVHWHLGLAWALHALLRRAFCWFPDKILEHAPEVSKPAQACLACAAFLPSLCWHLPVQHAAGNVPWQHPCAWPLLLMRPCHPVPCLLTECASPCPCLQCCLTPVLLRAWTRQTQS